MKNAIALVILSGLMAIPTVATLLVHRDQVAAYRRKVAKALAFDPRHPGMVYNIRQD